MEKSLSSSPLLVLDTHYLCHRAFHSQRGLSWDGVATGVIFGFLKSIRYLKQQFMTDRIAFCFEGKTLHRTKDFPLYKHRRQQAKDEPERQQARIELHKQITALREEYLFTIGFRNVFHYDGFESDDIMASLARAGENTILITSDTDLYQCLAKKKVQIFSPHKQKLMTEKWFSNEYGIPPARWAMIKAIAGCDSDGVPGIPGIGELPKDSKAFQSIISKEGKEIVRRNRQLVELPYSGALVPKIRKDEIDLNGWETICCNLGFKSIINLPPIVSGNIFNI